MLNYIIIFSIFFLVTISAFYSVRNKQSIILFYLVYILCSCFAFLRPETVDRDYKTYKMLYDSYSDFTIVLTEPTFIFICYLVRNFLKDNIFFLFVIYAILGVGIKMYAIKKISEFYLLSLLIYLSTFFLLHEMTQIRAGVASGFFLLCIPPIYERDFKKFIFFAILAISFHYSAIIIIPLFFILKPDKIDAKIYITLLLSVYILHVFNIHFTGLLENVPLENVQNKLEANQAYSLWNDDKINVFNVLQLIRILIAIFFIRKADIIFASNKHAYILIKIYFISLAAMVFFADVPTFAVRISELLGVVEIILLPCIMYVIKPKEIAAILVMLTGLFFLMTTLFYTKLLNFNI